MPHTSSRLTAVTLATCATLGAAALARQPVSPPAGTPAPAQAPAQVPAQVPPPGQPGQPGQPAPVVVPAPKVVPNFDNPQRPFNVMVGDKAANMKFSSWILGEATDTWVPGKIYVLHYWAKWCDECLQFNELLTSLQNEFHDQGVEIIGVTSLGRINTLNAVTKYVFEEAPDEIGYSIAWDPQRVSMDVLLTPAGRDGPPAAVLIDRQGRIAMIGHPAELELTLRSVVAGTFDREKEAARYANCIWGAWLFLDFERLLAEQNFGDAFSLGYELVQRRAFNCYMVMSNIAWVLVDPRNRPQQTDLNLALRAAELANEMSGNKDPQTLSTLAEVYVARGEFEAAVTTQRRAAELVRAPRLKARIDFDLGVIEKRAISAAIQRAQKEGVIDQSGQIVQPQDAPASDSPAPDAPQPAPAP